MASVPTSGPASPQPSAVVGSFAAWHYEASGSRQFGMDEQTLAALLAEVVHQHDPAGQDVPDESFLLSLRLEELVLARACAAGNEQAWEVFLTRYRATLYETAYKVAKEESAARALADSLYAELYSVDSMGQQRLSKLRYYSGRGSLQGWLRTVVAQEWVNHCRSTKRETSLEAAVDDGIQFTAPEPEAAVTDKRVETAVSRELAELDAEERFLLLAYYLDRRTLAEIAKLQGVHESTISRKLERTTIGLRNRIAKRLVQLGMSRRQAEEAMQEVDVCDLQIRVDETLRQGSLNTAFYQEKGESRG